MTTPEDHPAPSQAAPSKRIQIVVDARSAGDAASPRFAVIQVDQAFLDLINKAAQVCNYHGFASVRMAGAPEWSQQEGTGLRASSDQLAVASDCQFWFEAYTNEGPIVTEAQEAGAVQAMLNAAQDGDLVFMSYDSDELQEAYEKATADSAPRETEAG